MVLQKKDENTMGGACEQGGRFKEIGERNEVFLGYIMKKDNLENLIRIEHNDIRRGKY